MFIPLLSKTSFESEGYHKLEWEWVNSINDVLDDHEYAQKIKICPVIVDDSDAKDVRFEAFADFLWVNIPEGKATDHKKAFDQLVEEIKMYQNVRFYGQAR